jgi:hypothetical protein
MVIGPKTQIEEVSYATGWHLFCFALGCCQESKSRVPQPQLALATLVAADNEMSKFLT